MILHVVAFRWKEDADQAQLAELRRRAAGFEDEIPEVVRFWFGEDLGLRPGNADFAVAVLLRRAEDVAGYFAHPSHAAAIRDLALPNVAERLAVQFEIPDEESLWPAR